MFFILKKNFIMGEDMLYLESSGIDCSVSLKIVYRRMSL